MRREPKAQTTELGRSYKDDELIRKTANGRFQMFKSNFDFLEKPLSQVEDSHELRQQVKKRQGAKSQL
jgi:hypothetical protein